MNTCTVSGWVQGSPELRVTQSGRRILNFEVAIDGPGPREPYCPIAYFLAPGEDWNLQPGDHVFVTGPLRHHRARGLFIGASEIMFLASGERDFRPAPHPATPNERATESAVAVES